MEEEERLTKENKDSEFARTLQEQFKTFECMICLEPHPYDDRFCLNECGHEFCITSIREHCKTQINGHSLPTCPHPDHKKPFQISQQDVDNIIPPDLEENLRSLELEKGIITNQNIVYCKRAGCKGLALV